MWVPVGPALPNRSGTVRSSSPGQPATVPRRETAGGRPAFPGMELTCPKCQGTMRTCERNGVHVDQCTECRGIFLDRGELERLVDAENAWHGGGAAAATSASAARPADPHLGQQGPAHAGRSNPAGQLGAVIGEVLRPGPGSSHGSQYGHGTPHRKRKDSFLSDLFG